MKVKEVIGYVGYSYFAKYLPKSNARLIGGFSKYLRRKFVKMFVNFCGGGKYSEEGGFSFGSENW